MAASSHPRQRTTLETLIGYAVQAPSSHNTQPWRFRVEEPSRILLYADRTRGLPVNDPSGRELTLSCGAALETLVVAARAFGFDVVVQLGPDPSEPDLLAILAVTGERWPSDEEAARFVAIADRRTQRGPFTSRPIQPALVAEFERAASEPGVWVVTVPAAWRRRLGALVALGDRRQFRDRSWRAELAAWVRPRRTGDGLALPPVPAWIAGRFIRSVNAGRRLGLRDAALVDAAPVLAVLGTDHDDPASWMAAGRALQRALLTAAFHGVQAGFCNQPCQIDGLRGELRDLIGRDGWPQAIVRLGYPAGRARLALRRPLDAVLARAE